LHEAFDAVMGYIRQQDISLFDRPKAEGKWSTGQQLDHLIKSVKPLSTGMALPRFMLKLRFGSMKRAEYTYDELAEKYKEVLKAGGEASSPFIPTLIEIEQKETLLKTYESEKIKLIKILQKWSENDLSNVSAPHPLLGKCSVRELLYFTIFHNYHHLESIKEIS